MSEVRRTRMSKAHSFAQQPRGRSMPGHGAKARVACREIAISSSSRAMSCYPRTPAPGPSGSSVRLPAIPSRSRRHPSGPGRCPSSYEPSRAHLRDALSPSGPSGTYSSARALGGGGDAFPHDPTNRVCPDTTTLRRGAVQPFSSMASASVTAQPARSPVPDESERYPEVATWAHSLTLVRVQRRYRACIPRIP